MTHVILDPLCSENQGIVVNLDITLVGAQADFNAAQGVGLRGGSNTVACNGDM